MAKREATEVCRELKNKVSIIMISSGKIFDFYDPYWRVEFNDGDWKS